MSKDIKGQISIFEYIKELQKEDISKNDNKLVCAFSKHSCNKEYLFEQANMLYKEKGLDMPCPEVCCRQCSNKGCGARCNGSEEPAEEYTYDRNGRKHKAPKWMHKNRCENCHKWVMYGPEEQPPSGWGVYGWCSEYKQRVNKASYCSAHDYKEQK